MSSARGNKTAHQANEYIEVEAMIESAKIIALLLWIGAGFIQTGRMRMLKSIKNNGVTAVLDHDGFNKRIRVVRYDGAIEKALPDIVAAAKEEGAEKSSSIQNSMMRQCLPNNCLCRRVFLRVIILATRLVSWSVTSQKTGDKHILI